MYSIRFEDGKEFDITAFSVVGRKPDPTILETAQLIEIDDITKTMSKSHIALAVTPDNKLMIEDLESTNGTFIAGLGEYEEQVFNGNPVALSPNQRVRLGEVFFDVIYKEV